MCLCRGIFINMSAYVCVCACPPVLQVVDGVIFLHSDETKHAHAEQLSQTAESQLVAPVPSGDCLCSTNVTLSSIVPSDLAQNQHSLKFIFKVVAFLGFLLKLQVFFRVHVFQEPVRPADESTHCLILPVCSNVTPPPPSLYWCHCQS